MCSKKMGYNKDTSSKLTQYRAMHENKEETIASSSQDITTFRCANSEYFLLYILKAMVEAKSKSAKKNAKAKAETVAAVSLISDMWTSINLDAYLDATCVLWVRKPGSAQSCFGVQAFPQLHTADSGRAEASAPYLRSTHTH